MMQVVPQVDWSCCRIKGKLKRRRNREGAGFISPSSDFLRGGLPLPQSFKGRQFLLQQLLVRKGGLEIK